MLWFLQNSVEWYKKHYQRCATCNFFFDFKMIRNLNYRAQTLYRAYSGEGEILICTKVWNLGARFLKVPPSQLKLEILGCWYRIMYEYLSKQRHFAYVFNSLVIRFAFTVGRLIIRFILQRHSWELNSNYFHYTLSCFVFFQQNRYKCDTV